MLLKVTKKSDFVSTKMAARIENMEKVEKRKPKSSLVFLLVSLIVIGLVNYFVTSTFTIFT